MPYTPPSHRSPSSSVASSPPEISRRSSFQTAFKTPPHPPTSTHVTLPRSASYLTRHRRTPSAVANVPTPDTVSKDLMGMVSVNNIKTNSSNNQVHEENGSVRQSPPPVTGDRRGMPTGAVISPPESPSNGSDDDEANGEGEVRGRRMENLERLSQLHEAISQLPHRREVSPSETSDTGVPMVRPLKPTNAELIHHSFSTGSLQRLSRRTSSASGRRVSHFRSATEPAVGTVQSAESAGSSVTCSDEENDLDMQPKPQMVRKKSGELVRPALRLGSRRRPSSMPGTPTFSKAVHFDSHLEHVRHFLQVDRPLAVSAGSSPVETYDSESEYPFSNTESRRNPPCEWEIILTKFPIDSPARKALPVRLERVWLSPDQKMLLGSVAVLNMAFSKYVVCRFTLDYWKTTSEVVAEYAAEILPRMALQGHDRFTFGIKLSDMANLESKTLYFCIRYNVDGKEFWDNNGGGNFQLDFRKKMLPINGKAGLQSNGLPRSNRRPNHSLGPRPVSMPPSFDEFGDGGRLLYDHTLQDYLGEPVPTLRLKSSQSTTTLPSDNLSSRLSTPSGAAFANRYDFGASLSAAMMAAKEPANKDSKKYNKDMLYMRSGRGSTFATSPAAAAPAPTAGASNKAASFSPSSVSKSTATTKPTLSVSTKTQTQAQTSSSVSGAPHTAALGRGRTPPTNTLAGSSALHDPGSIASKSYDEIVSKYCFYVPKQPSQTKDAPLHSGQINGTSAGELVTQSQGSPASTVSEGSPLQMGGQSRRTDRVPIRSTQGFPPKSVAYMAPRSLVHDAILPPPSSTASSPSGSSLSSGSSRSASPASPSSLVNAFPFAAESTLQHLKDQFPFSGPSAHSTAIRG